MNGPQKSKALVPRRSGASPPRLPVHQRKARLVARKLRVEINFINSPGKHAKARVYASCRVWPVCTDIYFSPGAAMLAVAHGATASALNAAADGFRLRRGKPAQDGFLLLQGAQAGPRRLVGGQPCAQVDRRSRQCAGRLAALRRPACRSASRPRHRRRAVGDRAPRWAAPRGIIDRPCRRV